MLLLAIRARKPWCHDAFTSLFTLVTMEIECLPSPLDDKSLWYAHEFTHPRTYTLKLDATMRREIIEATHSAESARLDSASLTPLTFHLPSMGGLMDDVLDILELGRRFVVLRAIPAPDLTRQGRIHAIAGISRHLGELVSQNAQRTKVETITDNQQPLNGHSRGYGDTRGLPFHTDGSDYVALLCVARAHEGGESLLASAAATYEAIRHERPDLLRVLECGLYHHRRAEQHEGEPPILRERQPVFRIVDGRMHAFYNRNAPEWLEKEGIITTEAEIQAQNYLDAIFQRPAIKLCMTLEAGDLQLLNNYTIVHARAPYRDTSNTRRQMLRAWIRSRAALRRGPNIIDVYAPWESRLMLPAHRTSQS